MTTIENLVSIRKSQRKSQDHVAERLGVSQMTIHNWESGKSQPSIDMVERYAEELGFKVVLQILL
jgi:transcriptional regulator with XRE-family HTH domain